MNIHESRSTANVSISWYIFGSRFHYMATIWYQGALYTKLLNAQFSRETVIRFTDKQRKQTHRTTIHCNTFSLCRYFTFLLLRSEQNSGLKFFFTYFKLDLFLSFIPIDITRFHSHQNGTTWKKNVKQSLRVRMDTHVWSNTFLAFTWNVTKCMSICLSVGCLVNQFTDTFDCHWKCFCRSWWLFGQFLSDEVSWVYWGDTSMYHKRWSLYLNRIYRWDSHIWYFPYSYIW